MNATEKLEMQISEETDGSATVKMPPGEGGENQDDNEKLLQEERDNRDSRLNSKDNDEDDDDDDGKPDSDPEREKIRAARREERKLKKQLHREKAKESNQLINVLKRQNDQLTERIAVLEKRTAGADEARLDKAIEDASLRVQYAKMRISEATKAQNGDALADANEQWYEARRELESLQNMKKKSAAAPRDSAVPKAPDPRLQRHAADWMARNDWYDPQGRDTDSKIAVQIDEALSDEGWDPTSEDYWDELDSRLEKYLPHRYGRKDRRGSADSDDDTGHKPTRRPRSVVTGSGRESSPSARPGEFRLSPDRVKAIKDAGKWDDPVERQKMVRRYAEYDRNLGVR